MDTKKKNTNTKSYTKGNAQKLLKEKEKQVKKREEIPPIDIENLNEKLLSEKDHVITDVFEEAGVDAKTELEKIMNKEIEENFIKSLEIPLPTEEDNKISTSNDGTEDKKTEQVEDVKEKKEKIVTTRDMYGYDCMGICYDD